MRRDRKIVNYSHPISEWFQGCNVSNMEDKIQVHNFNGFRYVFQYYYLIDLTWDFDIYTIKLIKFYNHSVWFVIF